VARSLMKVMLISFEAPLNNTDCVNVDILKESLKLLSHALLWGKSLGQLHLYHQTMCHLYLQMTKKHYQVCLGQCIFENAFDPCKLRNDFIIRPASWRRAKMETTMAVVSAKAFFAY